VLKNANSVLQRVMEKIRRGEDGCWIWEGSTSGGRKPYGTIMVGGKQRNVRRLLYEILRGAPGEGKLVSSCEADGCVNPDHLVKTEIQKGGRRSES
jgi:hypothetical protein